MAMIYYFHQIRYVAAWLIQGKHSHTNPSSLTYISILNNVVLGSHMFSSSSTVDKKLNVPRQFLSSLVHKIRKIKPSYYPLQHASLFVQLLNYLMFGRTFIEAKMETLIG